MRLVVALLIGLLAALRPVCGAEKGRFEIAPGPPMILLDTSSGKTWRYDMVGQWEPIKRLKPKPLSQRKETLQQRGQRELDARRLKLNKTGPPTKPESRARTILNKLVPAK